MTRLAVVASQLLLLAVFAGCSGTPAPPSPSAPSAAPTTPVASSPAPVEPTRTIAKVNVLGVVGDSISLAVNACDQAGPCPAQAWAGGEAPGVDSIATRLGEQFGTRPEVLIAAKDGGDVADAADRIGRLAAKKPDLVTILVGANDACAPNTSEMTEVDDFREQYADVLTQLADGAPDALALAMSVPDVNQIWELGRKDPGARQSWSKFWGCRNLLRDPTSDAPQVVASREAVADRVRDYNEAIAEVCAAAKNCVSDEAALNEHDFTSDEVSALDFFHPSKAGQRAIAEIAWNALERQVKLP